MVSNDEPRRAINTVQVPYHELQVIQSEVQDFTLGAGSAIEKGFVAAKQPLMCDFEIVKHDTNPASFFIALYLQMENTRKNPNVLSFEISTVTGFEYRPNSVAQPLPDDEEVRWHLFFNAVSTAIGIARGYMINYLAPTIYRDYQLPLLNVKQLVDKKYARPSLPSVPSSAPSEKPPVKPKKKGDE
jgi:hypothetical protein